MAKVSFLVEYGAWVWRLLLLAFVALGLGTIRMARQWRSSRAARSRLGDPWFRAATRTIQTLERGPSVLHGRLRGTAVTERRGPAHTDSRTHDLALEIAGGAVDIRGPVRVEQPTRHTSVWSWWHPSERRVVIAGDEVYVMCEVANEHDPYRDQAPHWFARAREGETTVRLIGLGSARSARAPIITTLACATALAIVGYGAMKLGATAGFVRGDVVADKDIETAACFPGSRPAALHAYANQLRYDRADLGTELEVATLRGACPAEIYDRLGHWDEALSAARACGTRHDLAIALLRLGQFNAAARSLETTDTSDEANTIRIAAGDWANVRSQGTRFRCLDSLYAAWANTPKPFGEGSRCDLASAIAAANPLELQAFADTQKLGNRELGGLASLIATLDGGDWPSDVVVETWPADGREWLGGELVRRHPGHRDDRALIRAVLRGDFVAARELVLPSEHRWADDYIAMAAGAALTGLADTDAKKLRRGEPPLDLRLETSCFDTCDELRAAFGAASAGDGAALASYVTASPRVSIAVWDLILGVAPRIEQHREELVAALRYQRSDLMTTAPFLMLYEVALHRDVFAILGAPSEASRMQEIYERYEEMLGDTRKVIAFLLEQ